MVQALDLPLLALAVPNLQKLNDLSADELSCMWTVFSKCKDNLEHGRRLENMSWRLWFRETASQKQTCNEPHPTQNPIPIQSPLGSPHSNYSLNESPNSTAGPQTPKDHDRRNSSMKQASTASFKRIISSLGINKPDSRPLNVLSHTDHLPTNVKALCNPITPITPVSLPQVPPSVPESQPLNAPTPITARPGKFFIYAEDESDHGDYRFSSDDDDDEEEVEEYEDVDEDDDEGTVCSEENDDGNWSTVRSDDFEHAYQQQFVKRTPPCEKRAQSSLLSNLLKQPLQPLAWNKARITTPTMPRQRPQRRTKRNCVSPITVTPKSFATTTTTVTTTVDLSESLRNCVDWERYQNVFPGGRPFRNPAMTEPSMPTFYIESFRGW